MIRNKNVILALCIMMLSVFSSTIKVQASAFVTEVPRLFEGLSVRDRREDKISKFGYIYVNNELVYCIEPLKIAIDGSAMVPHGVLSEELKTQISIIAYAGYGENRISEHWYAATQILIWEILGYDHEVRGFDDYGAYRQEMLNRVAQYETLPSFVNEQITLQENESITLHDSNQVLHLFENVTSSNPNFVITRNGSELTIQSNTNKTEHGNIQFKKFEDNKLDIPIVYIGETNMNTQALIKTRINKNVEGDLTLRNQAFGSLVFKKTGSLLTKVKLEESEFGTLYTPMFQEGVLKDTLLHIYASENIYDVAGVLVYEKDELVDVLISAEGDVESKLLHSGTYYAKEIATAEDHTLIKDEYVFEISDMSQHRESQELNLINTRSGMNLEFRKVFEHHSNINQENLYKDVRFGVYTGDPIYNSEQEMVVGRDELVHISGLKSDGTLEKQIDLPFGNYYLKELTTHEDYVLDTKSYPFEITGSNEEYIEIDLDEKEILNYLVRSNLRIYKVDEETKKPLKAQFVLYDQFLNKIAEFETNEEGEFLVDNLVNGTYFIQETKSPNSYVLDPSLHKIAIKGNDIEIRLSNKKAEVVETFDSTNTSKLNIILITSAMVLCLTTFKRVFMS